MPSRIRRHNDAVRFASWVVVTSLLLLLGDVALGTAAGLEEDLASAITTLPDLILSLLAWASNLLLLVLPPLLVADLALRRRWRTLLVAVTAGVTGWLVAYAFLRFGPDAVSPTLLDALTTGNVRGHRTDVAFPLVTGIVAFASVDGLTGRPRLAAAVWGGITGFTVLLLFDRAATPLALALSASGGRAVGVGFRYAFGTANPRPAGNKIATALARVAVPLAYLELVDDNDEGRYYMARTLVGAPLDVVVIDYDRRSAGLLYQLYRRLRVQRGVERRPTFSVRRAVDQAALPVFAALRHQVRTPALVAAASVNRDAAVLAFEHVSGLRTFNELTNDELTDDLVADLWNQVRSLHRAGIAHEELHAKNLAIDPSGQVWLLGLDSGEIAADQLTLRLDDAELLVTTAQLVGADRAVLGALQELTAQRLGEALPLLQAIALSQTNRRNLKQHPGLMAELRDAVVAAFPAASTEPVRLDRVRPRTVVGLFAFMVAVTVLLGQLASVNLVSIFTEADPAWVGLAFVASVATYIAAAVVTISFAPVVLNWLRTFWVQVASSFVSLVAPAAVGHIGTNTRYLQQQGVPPAVALASVGASQVFVFFSYLVLVVVFGVFTGRQQGPDLLPGRTVIVVVGGVVIVGALAVAVPWTRRVITERLKPMLEPTLPRLVQMARQPRRIALAMTGSLALNLAYAVALFAAVEAYGGSLAFPTVGFVYLAAGAIGSAAPTPGGIGAVEAALAAGLTAAGLDGATAVQSALLFRAATFWVPVIPGWFTFQWLQRTGDL
ncbi:MAG TPA: lysylphosphatidylglycerol synthase transmembrane domain-containing protein [Actinomycetes bacterium]|nr:lysylphosphatidylglycerol synthase transmembrane domain-containing protein [Actinomycetes bacterium]